MTKEIIHKYPLKIEIKNKQLILKDGASINFEHIKDLISAESAGQECEFIGLIVESEQLFLQYYFK
jgi:hypothetical protein